MVQSNFTGIAKQSELLMSLKIVPNITGYAGIGKSELVQGIAKDMDAKLVTITCSGLQEGDLALPLVSKNNEVNFLLHPALREVMDNWTQNCLDADGNVKPKSDWKYTILFLDEINRALIGVQNELMNLVLQREIQGNHLPKNCMIVAASNPTSDMEGFEDTQYATVAGDNAINDRMVALYMRPDLEDWTNNYARVFVPEINDTRIDSRLIEFLNQNPEFFHTEDSAHAQGGNEISGNATPRSWTRVSKILRKHEKMVKEGFYNITNDAKANEDMASSALNSMLQGNVGNRIAQLFMTYLETSASMLHPKDLLEGKMKDVSDEFKNYTIPQQVSLLQNTVLYFIQHPKANNETNAKRFYDIMELSVNKAPDSVYPVIHMMYDSDELKNTAVVEADKGFDIVIGLTNMEKDKDYDFYPDED